jgi:hypothetical protein
MNEQRHSGNRAVLGYALFHPFEPVLPPRDVVVRQYDHVVARPFEPCSDGVRLPAAPLRVSSDDEPGLVPGVDGRGRGVRRPVDDDQEFVFGPLLLVERLTALGPLARRDDDGCDELTPLSPFARTDPLCIPG